jgi:hypothetical protein
MLDGPALPSLVLADDGGDLHESQPGVGLGAVLCAHDLAGQVRHNFDKNCAAEPGERVLDCFDGLSEREHRAFAVVASLHACAGDLVRTAHIASQQTAH